MRGHAGNAPYLKMGASHRCAPGRRRNRTRERGRGKDPKPQANGQEAARFLIEPKGRMLRIEPRCAGTKGSPAPNAPLAL